MPKKIKATYHSGAPEQRRCAMSQRLFDQEKGLSFSLDGDPIDPVLAKKVGYELQDIRPPESVKCQMDLVKFITDDLGISRSDPKYLGYYGTWHDFFPQQTKY